MASTTDRQPKYIVQGVVVDRASQRAVRGVRIEAWDRDTRYHDLLGQAITDERGAFTIGFDSDYFGDFAPDRAPDVFFKVFLDDREVLNTFERPLRNADRGTIRVKLEIEMPQLRPEGQDRVSAEQAIKMADWWRASDFRGVFRESRDKAATVGKLFGSLAGRSVESFDFAPLRPRGTRERDVVDQDVTNAQRALALQRVEVAEVRPVGAEGPRAELRSLKDYALRLEPGDRVTLYEENGVVKYYTRVPAVDPGQVDGQTVARIDDEVQSLKAQVRGVDALRTEVDNLKTADRATEERISADADGLRTQAEEVARLRRELLEVRQAAADKDAEIVKLRSDLANVHSAQDNLAARIPLNRLEALEQQIELLQRRAVPAPPGARAPARPRAAPAAARGADEAAGGKTEDKPPPRPKRKRR